MVFLMALVLFSIVALLLPTKFNKKISFVLEGNIYYRAIPFFKKNHQNKTTDTPSPSFPSFFLIFSASEMDEVDSWNLA